MPPARQRLSFSAARVPLLALIALVLVAGCGGGTTLTGKVVKEAGQACKVPPAVPPVEGKPAASGLPARPPTGKLSATDLKPGTGDEAKEGERLTVQLYVVSCATGAQLFSTWDAAPTTTAPPDPTAPSTPPTTAPAAPTAPGPSSLVLRAPTVPPGLLQGLKGMKVGGQRRIIVPPNLGLGAAGGALPVGGTADPNDTLVFVVQLDKVEPGPPPCADATVVDAGPDKAPTVTFAPDAYGPDSLVKKDLKEGTGNAVKTGDKITVNYVGFVCSNGHMFDTSWKPGGQPLTATLTAGQLIKGWTDGVPGMKPGGRRVLVIPPNQAYGAAGQGSDIPPNAALFFVIDLIKVG